jgi:8-oxo-dGTP pyrophosphatase MutT (NUDIX family)
MAIIHTIESVRTALVLPLPGRSAQVKMSTRPRPGDIPPFNDSEFRDGAVLILLYPVGGELYLPLTKRTTSVDSHKGHISLPGGAREPGETLVQTALREAEEEIGVSVTEEAVMGQLSLIYVPVSRYRVTPFVAALGGRPEYHPDSNEVEELIETPLRLFLDDRDVYREWQTHLNRRMLVPFYGFGEHKIWGATAMILAEFGELLSKSVES